MPTPFPPRQATRCGWGWIRACKKAAEDEFAAEVKYGDVVGMNIKTGEIMLLYTQTVLQSERLHSPGFLPRAGKRLISDPQTSLQIWRSRTGSPPAHVKIVMALAALQEGRSRRRPTFIALGHSSFTTAVPLLAIRRHGRSICTGASSNPATFILQCRGSGWISTSLQNMLPCWGLGSQTGIDLPNEAKGLVPSRAWKKATSGISGTRRNHFGRDRAGPGPDHRSPACFDGCDCGSDGAYVNPNSWTRFWMRTGRSLKNPREETTDYGYQRDNFEFVKQALWSVVNEYGTGGKARIPATM